MVGLTETHLLGEPGPETRGPRTPGTEKAELDTATGVLAPTLPGPTHRFPSLLTIY